MFIWSVNPLTGEQYLDKLIFSQSWSVFSWLVDQLTWRYIFGKKCWNFHQLIDWSVDHCGDDQSYPLISLKQSHIEIKEQQKKETNYIWWGREEAETEQVTSTLLSKTSCKKKRCLLEVRSNMENNLTSSAAVVCATWQTNLIKTWLWPTSSKEIYVSDMIRYGQNKALMWSGVLISGATL